MATEKPRLTRRSRGKEQMSSAEFPSPRMLEMLAALEKRGLLEAATGALNDEATLSELMAVFSSDET
jgi:predicted transcriptional regulator